MCKYACIYLDTLLHGVPCVYTHTYIYVSHSQHTWVYSAAQILQVACRAHRKIVTLSGCGPLHVLQICGRAVFSLLRLCLRVLRVQTC